MEIPSEFNVCETICRRSEPQCTLARQLRGQLTPIYGDTFPPINADRYISGLPKDENFAVCARPNILLDTINNIYSGKQMPAEIMPVVTNLQSRIP